MSSSASMILRASLIVFAAVFQTLPSELRYATEYLHPEWPNALQRMLSNTFDGIYVVIITNARIADSTARFMVNHLLFTLYSLVGS